DGLHEFRVGLHLRPQAIDQRRQALDIHSEAAEEPAPAPGLLGGETARLAAPGGELHRPGALDGQRPAVLGRLERIEETGGGADRRGPRASPRTNGHAAPPLRSQTPAHARPPEIAPVAGPPRLVGQRLLGRERLVLHEALTAETGGGLDPLHVGPGERGQPLARPGLAAGASERPRTACARWLILASGHQWGKVSAVRSQVTLRTAFTVCLAVVATAALVLFVFETRLSLPLTVAAMMVAIALDHVVRRMQTRGIRRGPAIAITALAVVLLLTGLLLIVVPTAVRQLREFIASAPRILE